MRRHGNGHANTDGAQAPSAWNSAMEYFVPPLVIPVAVMLAVLLFAPFHGPVA